MAIELQVREFGAGDPVVVLHGMLGNSANWQRPARALEGRHRVLTADLRNHGRSPHTATMTLSEMAQDVRDLLAARGLERAAVIGHSLGGKVAMTLALETPSWVTRLVVVDIAPVEYASKADLAHIVASLQRLPVNEIADLADADRRLAADLDNAVLRGFLLTNLKAGPHGYSWRVNLDAIAGCVHEVKSFPAALATAPNALPALFVAGGKSDYILPSHHAAIRRHFPAAEILTLADAGHWLHVDRADAFMAALAPFLAAGTTSPTTGATSTGDSSDVALAVNHGGGDR